MTGRPYLPTSSSSRLSVAGPGADEPAATPDTTPSTSHGHSREHSAHLGHEARPHHHHQHRHEKFVSQVAEWLQAEKAKRAAKRAHKRGGDRDGKSTGTESHSHSRRGSDASAFSLETLQQILEDNMSTFGAPGGPQPVSPTLIARRPSYGGPRRRSSVRKMYMGSSDTEYQDGDVVVPSCDAVLDNSKTMSYGGGNSESSYETVTLSTSKKADRAEKEKKAWLTFKSEILRLAHTLRLKGWRRVPLERGGDIEVKRLSGALTNAVYVVSPPQNLPADEKTRSMKPPPKLLLRIYGPQVEHLIDRENELAILRRLARKKIGPKMLGTFTNGRFEEFFNAETLTYDDLRIQTTSKQIAKRMRELHDGIDLLDNEREEGPFVWLNWDKWVKTCEKVITYLDKEVLSGKESHGEIWRSRGLVCGVEWPLFKATIDKYRIWLDKHYGSGGVNRRLVFAHNDVGCLVREIDLSNLSQTQYGNILRLVPETPKDGSAPSPLLLPENSHKQLVVIDFEYASANTPGLEFANHFTEWCYNYHDATKAWACNTDVYPTLEEQRNFIRSYLRHRPQFNPRASATPKMSALEGSSRNSISDFYLDSRTPGGSSADLAALNYVEEERQREQETERQVQDLLKEVRIWRIANSAQWVAWGIVQAQVPGLDAATHEPVVPDAELSEEPVQMKDGTVQEEPKVLIDAVRSGKKVEEEAVEAAEADEDEFDYLAYAQDRAMFFWGDVVQLGLVQKEELPAALVRRLKIVEY